MEVVNQIIAFFTPYLGEYARYVPIVIGTLLAIMAFVVRRRFVNKMNADIKAAKKKDIDSLKVAEPEVDAAETVQAPAALADDAAVATASSVEPIAEVKEPTLSWSQRIKSGLSRTRSGLGNGLSSVISGNKKVDGDLLEELETQLLMADVGIDATQTLMNGLTEKLNRKELKDADTLLAQLKADMQGILKTSEQVLEPANQEGPFVILMVGVNGVGKTTTIGKLAKKYQAEGKSVMLAAGDTFRAAAIDQLKIWGERIGAPVVETKVGGDAAGLAFEAIDRAKAEGTDVLLIDTAGRLQNKAGLMAELEKVVRVIKKRDPEAPHLSLLVLDATTGQNAINQVEVFKETAGLTGLIMTKLDGTARGGILVALAGRFGLPVHLIGVGEGIDDLQSFNAKNFARAITGAEK